MRVTALILASLCLLAALATGCASKATEDDCTLACQNVAKVALGEIDKQMEGDTELKDAGEAGKEMARTMAKTMMDGIQSECLKECKEKGTKAQAECLGKASSMHELEACK